MQRLLWNPTLAINGHRSKAGLPVSTITASPHEQRAAMSFSHRNSRVLVVSGKATAA
jgi:hypothetical protein